MVLLVLPFTVYALCLDLAEDRVQRSLHDLLALCLCYFPLALGSQLRLELLRRHRYLTLAAGILNPLLVPGCVFLLSNEAGDAIPA